MAEKKKAAPKEGKKKDQGEKNVIVSKFKSFYTNIASEYKKIIWPKKEELAKQTLVVIVICLIFGAIIFGMDSVFAAVLRFVARTI